MCTVSFEVLGPVSTFLLERTNSLSFSGLTDYNQVTGETSWSPPEDSIDENGAEISDASNAWTEQKDGDGNVYYFNTVTQESSWERPTDMDAAKQAEASAGANNGTTAEADDSKHTEWSKVWDPSSNSYYYYNNNSGDTQCT